MNESRRFLPPMAALTSFLAAARHGSFSRAGEQVGLTQSAVSRQVAVLEEWLQTSLFDRHGRRVELNEAGRAYAEQIKPALDRIRTATERTMNRTHNRELNIATLPSFGMRWLAPRLPRLTARHPEMTVNFAARSFPFDLEEEGFDAAIHFGQPDWPRASHLFLFREQAVAVCAPDWLHRNPLPSVAALLDKPLLFQASRRTAWNRWFAGQGMTDVPPLRGPVFEHFLMLAQAAAAGAGVALIPRFLIQPELDEGTLVIPFADALEDDAAYYLVRRQGWEQDGALAQFSAWMEAEAQTTQV
ncbi:transcriptional regulator GcvA [Flavisphingomonas formosensis]|uniref:transcriptional regulator GcvA n=1 Tax=Flavisphingomonas formosensis TaxID=861534 RepID=UPI0012FA140C|nr:transcriptional regulator GcvA [Sphingomonas formosensis]